jgi:hypothetical protein
MGTEGEQFKGLAQPGEKTAQLIRAPTLESRLKIRKIRKIDRRL